MTWLALIPKGLAEWGRLVAVALFVALMSFQLGQCDGRKSERQRAEAGLQKANNRYLQMKARADEMAADQRLADTIAVNEQERTLLDAIATTPDSVPDASRIALGCARLRRQGTASADLPAACRTSR